MFLMEILKVFFRNICKVLLLIELKICQLSRSAGSVPDELRLWFKEQQINYTQKEFKVFIASNVNKLFIDIHIKIVGCQF